MIITSYTTENQARYYLRWIYDLAVFVLVNVIGMTVLFGIVLDTFNCTELLALFNFLELRDERKRIEDDSKTYCFICGIDRFKVRNF